MYKNARTVRGLKGKRCKQKAIWEYNAEMKKKVKDKKEEIKKAELEEKKVRLSKIPKKIIIRKHKS